MKCFVLDCALSKNWKSVLKALYSNSVDFHSHISITELNLFNKKKLTLKIFYNEIKKSMLIFPKGKKKTKNITSCTDLRKTNYGTTCLYA